MVFKTGRVSQKPIQARAEETRNKVLKEARKAFAEKGFDGANTREISAAAGVAHTAIRYHFGNKDQLWRCMIAEMFAELEAEICGVEDDSSDAAENLNRFVRRYVAYCARNPEHARIMIAETARGGERLTWVVDEFIRKCHAVTAETIERAIAAGILPNISVQSLIYSIFGMSQTPFVLAREVQEIYGQDFSETAYIESHADAVLQILLRKPAA